MEKLQVDESRIIEETDTLKHRLTQLSTKAAKLEVELRVVHAKTNKLSDLICKKTMT